MKKYIILTFLILASLGINAQENDNSNEKENKTYKPAKKDFTVSINLGRGSYLTTGLDIMQGNAVSSSPSFSTVDGNNNNLTNMIGAEGRFFINNKWALSLSGGLVFSNTPATIGIPAVIDANGVTIIPAYNSVVSDSRMDLNYALGALYFFENDNKRLAPYLGFLIPAHHSTRSMYDPSINAATGAVSLGAMHVEVNGIGLQAVAGVDYFITESIYFGISIKPISYMHISNARYPGPGLYSTKIRSNSVASFVQPVVSIGFKL